MPRLVRIVATEVIVPAKPGTINSPGIDQPLHKLPVAGQASWSVQFDELPKCILEIYLDDGTVGLGELYRDHDWRVVENISRRLIGTRLDELPRQKLPIAHCREYDGFECAIWDAFAKVHGLPLVDLLGGPVQQRVRVGAWSGHRTLEEIKPLAARFADAGYDCIKFKCGLEDDVAGLVPIDRRSGTAKCALFSIRTSGGTLRPKRASASTRFATIGNVLCLEDPIPRWMLADYAQLRVLSPIPIVLHVSLPYIYHGQRVHDAIRALQLGGRRRF